MLTINQCRKLLGFSKDLSDSQVEQYRAIAHAIAEAIIESFLDQSSSSPGMREAGGDSELVMEDSLNPTSDSR